MTRSEIVAYAKRRYEEGTASSRFSDTADWPIWVDEAQLALFPQGCLQQEVDLPVAANDKAVRLPDRTAWTRLVYFDTTELVPATIQEIEGDYGADWMTDTGAPSRWMFQPPQHLRIVPIPTAAGTLHLLLWKYASYLVTDTSEPDFPEFLHHGIVWGTCLQALAQDKDLQGSAIARAYFQDNFLRYKKMADDYFSNNSGTPIVLGGHVGGNRFRRPRYTGEI